MRFSYSYGRIRYTPKDLIDKMKLLSQKLGRTPKMIDMDKTEGFPNSSTYTTCFGSWNKSLDAAGLGHNRNYGTEEILDKYLQLKKQLGKIPGKTDVENAPRGYPSTATYYKRYKTWNELIEAAVLREAKLKQVTQDDLQRITDN